MKLFGPNDSLTLVMSSAATTTNPTYHVRYIKNGQLTESSGSLSGATTVTAIPAALSQPNVLDVLKVYNGDSAAVTVTVARVVSGTSYTIAKRTLAVDDTYSFDGSEEKTTDSEGQAKGSADPTELAGVTAGTVTASKALVVDSNKDLTALRNLTLTNLDAGASGTAGTVDIFPTTASKGKTAFTCTDNTGNTTTTITNAAMATTRTFTIPDPLASCNFIMGTQAAVARTATADGLTTGTIADGGMLQHITVTSGSADHIIVLPTPTPGTIVVLHNGATGYELRSSAPATVAINGGAEADAESAIAANSTCVMICVTATAWKGFFLDADSDLAKVPAAAAA